MNLGIFGGSFSPVHRGHFEIANQLIGQSAVDRILVVPTYQNPFKHNQRPLEEELRLDMLEATFSSLPECTICDFELKRKMVSYSYKTIEAFSAAHPTDRLYLILGADAFSLFYQWTHVERILNLCELIVVGRQGSSENLSQSKKLAAEKMTWFELEIPEVSSTQIRNESPETLKASNWLHPEALKVWLNQSLSL